MEVSQLHAAFVQILGREHCRDAAGLLNDGRIPFRISLEGVQEALAAKVPVICCRTGMDDLVRFGMNLKLFQDFTEEFYRDVLISFGKFLSDLAIRRFFLPGMETVADIIFVRAIAAQLGVGFTPKNLLEIELLPAWTEKHYSTALQYRFFWERAGSELVEREVVRKLKGEVLKATLLRHWGKGLVDGVGEVLGFSKDAAYHQRNTLARREGLSPASFAEGNRIWWVEIVRQVKLKCVVDVLQGSLPAFKYAAWHLLKKEGWLQPEIAARKILELDGKSADPALLANIPLTNVALPLRLPNATETIGAGVPAPLINHKIAWDLFFWFGRRFRNRDVEELLYLDTAILRRIRSAAIVARKFSASEVAAPSPESWTGAELIRLFAYSQHKAGNTSKGTLSVNVPALYPERGFSAEEIIGLFDRLLGELPADSKKNRVWPMNLTEAFNTYVDCEAWRAEASMSAIAAVMRCSQTMIKNRIVKRLGSSAAWDERYGSHSEERLSVLLDATAKHAEKRRKLALEEQALLLKRADPEEQRKRCPECKLLLPRTDVFFAKHFAKRKWGKIIVLQDECIPCWRLKSAEYQRTKRKR